MQPQELSIFLDLLDFDLIPENKGALVGPPLPTCVTVQDNVSSRHGPLVRVHCSSKDAHGVPAYSPFLCPTEGGECMEGEGEEEEEDSEDVVVLLYSHHSRLHIIPVLC